MAFDRVTLQMTEVRHVEFPVATRNNIDWDTYNSIINQNEYRLRQLLHPGDLLIDIGAYVGGCTIAAVGLGARVMSVEPLVENYYQFRRTLDKNPGVIPLDRIEWTTGALHYGSSEYPLPYFDGSDDPSKWVCGHHGVDTKGHVRMVPAVTLEKILTTAEQLGWMPEDGQVIMKIDCEGCEWPVFASIEPETWSKLDLVLGEIHPAAKSNAEGRKELMETANTGARRLEDRTEELGMDTRSNFGFKVL